MSKTIQVDTKTFVRFWLVILGFALLVAFLWKAKTGLIIVGISIFLAIAIRPLGEKINKLFKGKRGQLSSVLAFVGIVAAGIVIVATIGPVVVDQTVNFVKQAPEMFDSTLGGWDGINHFGKTIGIEDLQGEISTSLQAFSSSFLNNFGNTVVNGVGAVASLIAEVVLILVLTLLFLLEGPVMLKRFWAILEGKKKDATVVEARRVFDRLTNVIATYVSRQVVVAILDGAATAIAVFILSLIFGFSAALAFPMGLVAMVFCLIPMFGQIIGCVLVSLVVLFNSPVAGLIFAAFYIIYAQVENNFIAPRLQGSALKLPAVVILSAITIGTYTLGLLGAIISIPIAGCVKVILEEYPRIKELRAE